MRVLDQRAPASAREGSVRRGSRRNAVALTEEYAAHLNHVRQCAAFTSSLGIEAPPGLGVVIDEIAEFVLPPAIAAATE